MGFIIQPRCIIGYTIAASINVRIMLAEP
jgi:hypothetical protein